MANLTLIHNAFDINDKTLFEIKTDDLNKPLYSILSNYIKEFENKDYDLVFSVNGITTENLGTKLNKGDHLAIVPIPAGGGGGTKNTLRIIAMIALVVVAPYATAALIGATGAAVSATTFYAIQAGVMIAGGLLINAVMPISVDSLSTSSDLNEVSPTYAFGGGSNANTEGTAIPIVLGKTKIVPPIISSYLSLNEDNQHLNVLYAINDGQFDTVHSININDQDIGNYTDIIQYSRYGTNNQTMIPNFSDNIATHSDGRALNTKDQWVYYDTASNAVDKMQLGFLLSSGLFYVQDNGNYSSRTIKALIEYREIGATDWKYED